MKERVIDVRLAPVKEEVVKHKNERGAYVVGLKFHSLAPRVEANCYFSLPDNVNPASITSMYHSRN